MGLASLGVDRILTNPTLCDVRIYLISLSRILLMWYLRRGCMNNQGCIQMVKGNLIHIVCGKLLE